MLGDGVGLVGGVGLVPALPPPLRHHHQQPPSAAFLDEKGADNGA